MPRLMISSAWGQTGRLDAIFDDATRHWPGIKITHGVRCRIIARCALAAATISVSLRCIGWEVVWVCRTGYLGQTSSLLWLVDLCLLDILTRFCQPHQLCYFALNIRKPYRTVCPNLKQKFLTMFNPAIATLTAPPSLSFRIGVSPTMATSER